ncbi:MAG TPA: cyclic nucleotide-binding domain-containing protein [Nitrospinae bacterium]|nr:cyclic nucleotide-binding domain-containing protein [Nitrospinota bacterium]
MFVVKEYRKGKTIVRQGTHSTSAFLIKKGKVEVFIIDAGGNKKVLASMKESDLFDEMALISNDARSAAVVPLEDCELPFLLAINIFYFSMIILLFSVLRIL